MINEEISTVGTLKIGQENQNENGTRQRNYLHCVYRRCVMMERKLKEKAEMFLEQMTNGENQKENEILFLDDEPPLFICDIATRFCRF